MKNKKVFFVILALFVAVAGAVVYGYIQHKEACDVCSRFQDLSVDSIRETLRHFIAGFGPWAIFVYILLYAANSFSPFFPPIIVMSLLSGVLFGPVWGTAALYIGTMTGTSAVFFTARYLGRDWVEKKISGKIAELNKKLSDHGFKVLLPMRLIGFPPYGLIDAACGLSKMTYRDFFLATLIGVAPWMIQGALGDRLANFDLKDPLLWILLAAFILMIFVTNKIVERKKEKNEIPEVESKGD